MTRNSMSYATELISTTPMDELQHRDATIFSTRCNSGNITTENRNFRREVHPNALIFNKNEVPEGISLILEKPYCKESVFYAMQQNFHRDAAKKDSRNYLKPRESIFRLCPKLLLQRSISQSSNEEVVELLYSRNQATFVW